MSNFLRAGAAQIEITPEDSQFLFGYPNVARYSTGVYDPIYSSALYLSDGKVQVIFIANDIIFVSKQLANWARKRIAQATGIPANNIMITATHTHSGPHTVNHLSNASDPMVPKVDTRYVQFFEDRIVEAAIQASENAQDAKLGLAIADDTGVGTNRRNPQGPADHNVPVLMVKSADDKNIACMLICTMHPTVLHEDSTLVSGDFPGLSRIYLQENVLGKNCVVLHHTGPAGNQSPRHVTKANTFEEAKRLGEILAKAVERVLPSIEYTDKTTLDVKQEFLGDLPRKSFPSVAQAQDQLEKIMQKFEHLQKTKAPPQETRTAECDAFGAEEALTLAKAAEDGSLEKTYASCFPVEIQIIKIGPWSFVGWQGEVFVEYPLAVKKTNPQAFVISLANGELQGYIVTKEAAQQDGYEASNGLFSYQAGQILVDKTLELLSSLK